MIDGKPNYTRLSTIAMADVVLMDEEGRIQFMNALCEMFDNIMVPEYQPPESPGFVGRAIQRQFAEFRNGIKIYMKNVTNNPSGRPDPNKTDTPNPVGIPVGIPVGTPAATPKEIEIEIEEESEKESDKKRKRFVAPTVEEVRLYFQEINFDGADPEYFIDFYQRSGWTLKNGQKVKDWKACARTWKHNNQKGGANSGLSRTRQTDRVPGQRDEYEF